MDKCEGCGAPVFPGASDCPSCNRPVGVEKGPFDEAIGRGQSGRWARFANALAFLIWIPIAMTILPNLDSPRLNGMLKMAIALPLLSIGPAFLWAAASQRHPKLGLYSVGLYVGSLLVAIPFIR